MSNVLTSELIVRLKDMVSGPSRKVAESMKRMQDIQQKHASHMADLGGKFLRAGAGITAFGLALANPIQASMDMQSRLEDIAQKGGLARDTLGALGNELKGLGVKTNQGTMEMANSMDTLMGLGATKDQALGLLESIGKGATAYGANTTDLANAQYAVLSNLKVGTADAGKSLDVMATAGKAGAFELKDMAQYMPSITAAYQGLGQTGVSSVADLAAALQITRKGTGDSASAATNLQNVLQKIGSPQTVTAFKKMGVNLEKEMKAAAKAGLTPIEAIAEITNKTLGGDLSKLGNLFQDAQVQQGLRPLIQNIELYRKIRADSLAASGTVEDDFNKRMETSAQKVQAFKVRMQNLSATIGGALLPALNGILDKVTPLIEKFSEFAAAHPKLVSAAVAITGGLLAARFAAIGLKLAFGGVGGVMLSAASGMLQMGPRLLGLLNPINVVKVAMIGLRVAVMSTGIGAIVLGIAAAGTAIYNNWNGITAMFSGFATAISTRFPAIGGIVDTVSSGVSTLVGWFGKMTGPVDMTAAQWTQLGVKIANVIGDAVGYVAALPGRVAGALAGLPAAFTNAAHAAGRALLDGLAAAMQAALDYVRNMASDIASAVTGAFTGGGEKYAGASGQTQGNQYGSYTPKLPSIDGKRARGGPVAGGKTYLVGERGPELFSPSRSGNITPNNKLGGRGGGVTIGSIVIHSAANADDIARQIASKVKSALSGIHSDIEYSPA